MQRSEDASVVTSPSAAGLQGGAAAGAAPSSLRRARQSAPGGNGSKLKLPGSLDEIHEQVSEQASATCWQRGRVKATCKICTDGCAAWVLGDTGTRKL